MITMNIQRDIEIIKRMNVRIAVHPTFGYVESGKCSNETTGSVEYIDVVNVILALEQEYFEVYRQLNHIKDAARLLVVFGTT